MRTPLALRVVARDPSRLDALGEAFRNLVARVPGVRSAVFESLGGEPWLDFDADDAAMALLHVDPAVARASARLVISGGQVGEMDLDGRKARVRVAPDANMHARMMPGPGEPLRGPADQVRDATVRPADGGPPVALALLGRARFIRRPAQLRAERGENVAYVHVDLNDGVDPAGFARQAQGEIDRARAAGVLRLGTGERAEWGGQYELRKAAERRLMWIAPVVLLSMLAMLWWQFRSLTEALLVVASVPFALVGSFWTLFLLHYPLSAPVWVGLLSTVGLAMQTGVVMVVYINEAFYRRLRDGRIVRREDIVLAHAEGTIRRLRPKLMTVTTMAASLLPLLWSDGAGAEIMKRVAAPMVGGLITSAALTLEVLPVLYTLWRAAQLRRAQRIGVSVEEIVGEAPGWARATTRTNA